MLEKEMAELQKALVPTMIALDESGVGVAKGILRDTDGEPIGLFVLAVEGPKIAAIDEFVNLLQMENDMKGIGKFKLNSKGESI